MRLGYTLSRIQQHIYKRKPVHFIFERNYANYIFIPTMFIPFQPPFQRNKSVHGKCMQINSMCNIPNSAI